MNGHTTTQRPRAFVASLIALVVVCFLGALCYPGVASDRASALASMTAPETVSAHSIDSGGANEQDEQGFAHSCPTPEEQGLLTAQPFLALGSALLIYLPVIPRAGPGRRRAHRDPTAPHGYRLLTLLCVQRV